MSVKRSDTIEISAYCKLKEQLQISNSYFVASELDKSTRNAHYDRLGITFKKTPDILITDGQEIRASDLMMIDVSEPTGGTLIKHGIDTQLVNAFKNAPLSNGMDGNYNRILLNPPGTTVNQEITSKLRKVVKKYSLDRNAETPFSLNTGVVFCMGPERDPKKHNHDGFYFNLSHAQFFTLVGSATRSVTGGRYGFKELHQNRDGFFVTDFCDEFSGLGFFALFGDDSATGYNYWCVNKRFLKSNSNIVAKTINKLVKSNV